MAEKARGDYDWKEDPEPAHLPPRPTGGGDPAQPAGQRAGEMGELDVLALQAADQAWAMVRERFADITRIAADGPRNDGHDQAVVLMVFNIVKGECLRREIESLAG